MRESRSHRVYLLCNYSTKDKKDLETTNIRTPLSQADICQKKKKKEKRQSRSCTMLIFPPLAPQNALLSSWAGPGPCPNGGCGGGGHERAPRREDPCRASVSADLVRVTKLRRGDTESTPAQTDYPSALRCEGEGRGRMSSEKSHSSPPRAF